MKDLIMNIKLISKKIIEDKNGNIWLGTNGGGLIKYDGQNFYLYKKESGIKSNYIYNLFVDDNNILWITTNYGLSRFDTKKNEIQSYFFNIKNQENINSITIDKSGAIWLSAGGSGLYKFFNDTLTQYNTDNLFIKNSIRCLALDKDDNIWIGTTDGLYKFDNHVFYKYDISNGLSGNYIMSIYIDDSNNVCVGTKYDGLNIIKNEKSIVQFKSSNVIDNYYVNSICQYDDGTYIVGGNGLHLFNNLLTNLQLKENSVKNMFTGIINLNDTIFITTQFGIRIIFDNDVTYLNLDKNIYAELTTIAKDRLNNIWVGTNDGFIMQLKGNILVPYYFVNARVDKIFFDNNNKLWVGTYYRGLYHIDKDSVYHFAKTTPFYNVSINDINQDSSNNIWISTYGKGLIKFANNKFTLYTENEGFPTNFFNQIEILDKNNLILTTSEDGIISFNLKKKTIKKHNNFFESDKENNFDIVVAFDKDRKLIVWDDKNIYYNIDNLNDKIYDRLTFVGDRLINNNSFKYMIADSKKNLWLSNFNSVSIANQSQTIRRNKVPNIIINNLIVNDKYIDFRDLIKDTSHAYRNYPYKNGIKKVFSFYQSTNSTKI
jgi:ligand-binding sensor domain-containing protein